jgi:glycosyltransferase involved in cell wall biosynthesis
MACGIPCAVTDVGDAALIVGETGRVAPPRDARALADAWRSLLDAGPEERRRLGQRARERVEEQFDLPLTIGRYVSLYKELTHSCAA